MPVKRGEKRGRYDKRCYHFNRLSEKSFSSTNQISNSIVYDFADEYDSLKAFLEDYEKNNDLYVFCKQDHSAVEKMIDAVKQAQALQANNEKRFCSRCKKNDPQTYDICTSRLQVATENQISFCIRQKTDGTYFHCPQCGTSISATGGLYIKRVQLQDVRLEGRPAKLLIEWNRPKCSSCNTFVGQEQLYGLEAYIDGRMTCRLAENVLRAQLSGVKREYIAEAYGITKGQIDRLRNRIIQEKKIIASRSIRSEVIKERDAPVEVLSFPIINTEIEYYAYFWVKPDHRIQLINLISSVERDSLSRLSDDSAEWKSMFPNAEQFYLSCYCILSGEAGLKGEELESSLELCDEIYRAEEDEYPEQENAPTLYYYSPLSEGGDRSTKREDIRRFLQLNKDRIRQCLPQQIPAFNVEENGQLLIKGFKEQILQGAGEQSEAIARITDFIQTLSAAVSRKTVGLEQLRELLLRFNPAVITPLELCYYSGKRYGWMNDRVIREEGQHMIRTIVGTPIECLSYFIRNGMIRQDAEQLLLCPLLHSGTAPVSGDELLPCGARWKDCPNNTGTGWA